MSLLKYILKENNIDLNLKREEKTILKAEGKDYDRGLIITLKENGGYDIQYWYGDPSSIYPAEIKIDGNSITNNGKLVHIGFHPELGDDKE